VPVGPIKPVLKAPMFHRLNLQYDEPLSRFAFNSYLRRYATAAAAAAADELAALKAQVAENEEAATGAAAAAAEHLAALKVGRCRLTPD